MYVEIVLCMHPPNFQQIHSGTKYQQSINCIMQVTGSTKGHKPCDLACVKFKLPYDKTTCC